MFKKESGQALVIVLLVMAVGLTMGLSVISRSVTDIRISQQEAESARAFSAAEAGIEQALLSGAGVSGTIGGIGYSVTPNPQGDGAEFDFGGDKFAAGNTQTVWLIEHVSEDELGGASFPASETISICWGDSTDINDQTPAIEAAIIYKDGGDYKLARGAYDPNSGRDNDFDGVDSAGGNNCSSKLAFRKDILLSDLGVVTAYALRLKLLYNDEIQPLAVKASGDSLPAQGTCYESTATVTQTGVSRKVRQCQFYKPPPTIFDYVLYSGGNLVK